MKPSTELFELIRSMSRSEKRFFKLNASIQKGEKNYLRLFDAIDAQKEYDEEAIKERFQGETFINHLPSEKNHLYKHILRTLRLYHSDDSADAQAQKELKNVEVLYRKRLFREARKFLNRARRLVERYEKFNHLLDVISWEKALLQESGDTRKVTARMDELVMEEKATIEKVRDLADHRILYSKMHFAFKSGGFVRSAEEQELVREIKEDPLLQREEKGLSSRAATLFHYIRGYCYSAELNREKAFQEFSKVRSILDEEGPLREDLPHRYIDTIRHLINYRVWQGDFDEAKSLLDELQALSRKKGFQSVNLQVRIFEIVSNSELLLIDQKGEHHRIHERMKRIEKGIEAYGEKMNKEQWILLSFNIAYVYFGAGERSKTINWLSRILNDKDDEIRRDLRSYARLFNLIVHYEQGNKELLEYLIRSTYRYLSKTKRDLRIETMILEYLKKLAKTQEPEQVSVLFREMKQKAEEILKDPQEHVFLEYFDLLAWLKSKTSGGDFSTAVREKKDKAEA
ncbi:MAG: hypothetical protein ABEH38_02765 [Flavobacteriales bacterium]